MSQRTLLRPMQTGFTPRSISGLALWLDAADSQTLYTTDAGPVTAVSAPTDIAGCELWFDASDTASITESGGLVSQWNDKSGKGRHATSSGSARPTTGTRTVGGRSALDFNGTSNSMTTSGSAFPTAATHTVFIVYQLDTASQSRTSVLLTASTITDQEVRVVGYGLSSVEYVFNNNAGTSMTTSLLGLGPIVFSAREATKAMRSAGAGVLSSSSGNATAWSSGSMLIGGRPSGNWLDGLICEIAIYNSTLSDTDTARVEAYLAAKWGIANVHAPATSASQPVGYWADKSGNGRHATQGTGASRPTVSATALNGRRQLGLVSQHLRGPSTSWNGSASIYWVGRTGQASSGAFVFGDGTISQSDSFHAGWLNTAGVGAYGNGWQSGNAPRAESPSAWRNADVVAGVTLSSTEAIARVNGATTNTTAALTGSLSQSAAAQFSIGQDTPGGWTNLNGSLAEILIYQPALSASQRTRLERYLAAKWGITLAPQVSNADAQDWVNRVYANGGTVSATTASAVNQFCVDIENAGIRDRFYRLNLFCGAPDASLAAVRTPLYRGPSLTGTQFGNATDTNVNFVAGDYAENVGLTSGATSKHLRIGTLQSVFGGVPATGHMSARVGAWPGTTRRLLGIFDLDLPAGQTHSMNYGLSFRQNGEASFGRTPLTLFTPLSQTATYLVNRSSSTLVQFYRDGSLQSSDTNQSDNRDIPTAEMTVFGQSYYRWSNNTFSHGYETPAPPMLYYSCGLSMTEAQVGALHTAMQAFQTALGRQV